MSAMCPTIRHIISFRPLSYVRTGHRCQVIGVSSTGQNKGGACPSLPDHSRRIHVLRYTLVVQEA